MGLSKKIIRYASKNGVSLGTKYDEAFYSLMDYWGLELSIDQHDDITSIKVYKEDNVISKFDLTGLWRKIDWDWNNLYKEVLEKIIKEKIFKNKVLNTKQVAKSVKTKTIKDTEKTLQAMRDERRKLYSKISWCKKTGRDYKEFEDKLMKLREEIKKK